jgi:hypothetical protein
MNYMNEIELIGQRKGKQLIIICLKIIKQVSINYRCVYKHYKRGGDFGGVREPPGGPRSGGEAMSEAKPVRWRPCEAGARPNFYDLSHAPPNPPFY